MKRILATLAIAVGGLMSSRADVVYTENFNSLGSGLPAGWSLSTNATATTLGTQGATFTQTAGSTTAWSDSGGAFKNVAAASLGVGSTTAAQTAAADRALGLRQTAAFGDPGAAFTFSFSTSGVTVSNLSIDLQMLSVQTRSTTFSIQYSTDGTTFSTLGTYTDPGAFGSQTFSFTNADFGTNLDNQTNAYFRIVALGASTGSGSRDTIGLDNFSLTSSGPITLIPEPTTLALVGIGALLGVKRVIRRK